MQTQENLGNRFWGKFQAVTSGLVLNKMAKIENKSKIDESTLIAIDCFGKAQAVCFPLAFLPSNLLSFVLGGIYLVFLLGWAGFLGYVFIIIGVAFGLKNMWWSKSFEMKALSKANDRLTTTKEVIQNIRGVKYSAWEGQYFNRMQAIRNEEAHLFELLQKFKVYGSNIGRCMPILASVFTFVVYSLLGHTLTVDIVFPALTIFQGMRMSMVLIPINYALWISVKVSLDRIDAFLKQEEWGEENVDMNNGSTSKNDNSTNKIEDTNNENDAFVVENLSVGFVDSPEEKGKGKGKVAGKGANPSGSKSGGCCGVGKGSKTHKKANDDSDEKTSQTSSEAHRRMRRTASVVEGASAVFGAAPNSDDDEIGQINRNMANRTSVDKHSSAFAQAQLLDSNTNENENDEMKEMRTDAMKVDYTSEEKMQENSTAENNPLQRTVTNVSAATTGISSAFSSMNVLENGDKIVFGLRNVTLNKPISRSGLTAVVGAVGSGKSTFLQSLIGEIPSQKRIAKRLNKNSKKSILEKHPEKKRENKV